MLPGRFWETGLRGGASVPLVRPRSFDTPFAPGAGGGSIDPFDAGTLVLVVNWGFAKVGGGFSSMGESGGGGMLVPSVREKLMGVNCGSSKRPLVVGILEICWTRCE